MTRTLNFVLPDFLRLAWVSEQARTAWSGRISTALRSIKESEWRSVAYGLRSCALIQCSRLHRNDLFLKLQREGIAFEELCLAPDSTTTGIDSQFLIGEQHERDCYQAAALENDTTKMGRLLGYPQCCCDHFATIQDIDPTWRMASRFVRDDSVRSVVLGSEDYSFHNNILLRRLGIQAIYHVPCSLSCANTLTCSRLVKESLHQMGAQSAWQLLEDVLTWPMAWSALHGIAEIRTPILKIATRTDATEHKFSVELHGTNYPAESGAGSGFIYRLPKANSKAASAGLIQLATSHSL